MHHGHKIMRNIVYHVFVIVFYSHSLSLCVSEGKGFVPPHTVMHSNAARYHVTRFHSHVTLAPPCCRKSSAALSSPCQITV